MDRRLNRAGKGRKMACAAGLALALASTGAWAQAGGSEGERGPDRRSREGRPLLSGPEVRDNAPPGVEGRFAPGQVGGREGTGIIPPQEFMRAIRSLGQMPPESGLALTPEQGEQLRKIMREFSESLPPEARRAMEGGPGRGEGGQPPQRRGPGGPQAGPAGPAADGAPSGPEGEMRRRGPEGAPMGEGGPEARKPGEGRGNPEMRQQMVEKLRGMQTRAWAVLTPAQAEHVKGELARMKAEREGVEGERRAMEYMQKRREGAEKGRGPTGAPGPSGANAEADPRRDEVMRERMDRRAEELGMPSGVREALKQMSPEQRMEFWQRVESRLREQRGEGGEPRRRRAAPGEPRPE